MTEQPSSHWVGWMILRISFPQGKNTGAPDKVRTRDPLITNQVLYQLSYKGNPVVPN